LVHTNLHPKQHLDQFIRFAPFIRAPCTAIASGSTVTFTARQTGGDATVTYLWDFGDQSTTVDTGISASSPAHTFTQPGVYIVRCTASNNVSRISCDATLCVVN